MGGLTSGRTGGTPTAEGCCSIVLDLDQVLALRGGRAAFGATLESTARVVFSIRLRFHLGLETGSLRIEHAAFQHRSSPIPAASYAIDLVSRSGQLGGRRWLMICPVSGRRVLKVYLPNGGQQFASRAAYRLGYACQRVDKLGNSHRRQAKLFRRLGAAYDGPMTEIPPKPARMHWSTYDQLLARIGTVRSMHETVSLPMLLKAIRDITGTDFRDR